MSLLDPTRAHPVVALVTVSFGSEHALPAFLSSIENAASEPIASIVVDNRARVGGVLTDLVESAGAVYLPAPRNLGYGSAINLAVRTLDPGVEWIVVSNPDVVLSPGSIDTLLATARADAGIGAVGPAILTPTGEVYPSARAVPSLRTGVGHALFANLWMSNPWTSAYRNDQQANVRRRNAGWLSGACIVVRRNLFVSLGGFDEAYFMYFEDVDLGYQIGRSGYRNVYEPAARVVHTGAHSTSEHSTRMVRAHHASAKRFLAKKYSGALLWPVRAGLGVGLWIRSRLVRGRLG